MSALMAAWLSASPAGRPSTMAVSPGPWLSPAVMTRSGTAARICGRVRGPAGGPRAERGLAPRGARGGGVAGAAQHAPAGVEAVAQGAAGGRGPRDRALAGGDGAL